MKVYLILPNLAAGGAERVTMTIARILRGENHDVEFINLGHPTGEMQSWIEPEFKMTSFGARRVSGAIPKLMAFMRHHRDAIFFSSREHVNLVGLIAAKAAGCRMVVRIPNMPKNKLTTGLSALKMSVIKVLNRHFLRTAEVVIAQNAEMRNQLLEYYRLPEEKVLTVYNPVDADYVRKSAEGSKNPFNDSEINFLSVCNVAYSKGIDILEEAWPKVKTAIPNAHMYVVGRDGSDYARKVVNQAQSLKDFTFLGFKNNPYPYLKHCDVFVLPSRMEGFPNVVLEAQCFNRPVVSTTCVAVIKDIIQPGRNGYYCDIGDAEALSVYMIKAVNLKDIKNVYDLFDKELLLNCFKRIRKQ